MQLYAINIYLQIHTIIGRNSFCHYVWLWGIRKQGQSRWIKDPLRTPHNFKTSFSSTGIWSCCLKLWNSIIMWILANFQDNLGLHYAERVFGLAGGKGRTNTGHKVERKWDTEEVENGSMLLEYEVHSMKVTSDWSRTNLHLWQESRNFKKYKDYYSTILLV